MWMSVKDHQEHPSESNKDRFMNVFPLQGKLHPGGNVCVSVRKGLWELDMC